MICVRYYYLYIKKPKQRTVTRMTYRTSLWLQRIQLFRRIRWFSRPCDVSRKTFLLRNIAQFLAIRCPCGLIDRSVRHLCPVGLIKKTVTFGANTLGHRFNRRLRRLGHFPRPIGLSLRTDLYTGTTRSGDQLAAVRIDPVRRCDYHVYNFIVFYYCYTFHFISTPLL